MPAITFWQGGIWEGASNYYICTYGGEEDGIHQNANVRGVEP